MARSIAFITLVLAACPATRLGAQDSSAPVLLTAPADTRAAALGDAFMTAGRDAGSLFYNPALTGQARGFSLGRAWYGAEGALTQVAAAMSSGNRGLAVGVRSLSYGAKERQRGLARELASSQRELFGPGSAAQEQAATVAGGMRLFGVRVGVAANLIEARLGTQRGATASFDIGVVQSLGPAVVGLAVQGLGPRLTLGSGATEQSYDAPTRASLNVGTQRKPVGPLDVALAAAVSGWSGYFATGGGLEVSYWPVVGRTITARLGVRHDDDGTHPTFGAAIQLDAVAFAYAFEHFQGGNAQRVGLTLRP